MIATIVNALTVILGGLIGVLVGTRVGDKFRTAVFISIGCVSLLLGIKLGLEIQSFIVSAVSLVLGGWFGYAIDLEGKIEGLGDVIKRRLPPALREGDFAVGFLEASLLFCVGSMTVVGSIRAGVYGDFDIIFTKSIMDGIMAILLAGTFGVGVIFSFVFILLYQGGLTFAAMAFGDVIPELVLAEVSGVGGVLILMIGLKLLGIKKVEIGNFLPALVLAGLLIPLTELIPYL
jgi:uncharacterized membrane protein YqgA involved in biofilm formation